MPISPAAPSVPAEMTPRPLSAIAPSGSIFRLTTGVPAGPGFEEHARETLSFGRGQQQRRAGDHLNGARRRHVPEVTDVRNLPKTFSHGLAVAGGRSMVAGAAAHDETSRWAPPGDLNQQIGPLRLSKDTDPGDVRFASGMRNERPGHRHHPRNDAGLGAPDRRKLVQLTPMLQQDSVASGKSRRIQRPEAWSVVKGLSWAHIKVELRREHGPGSGELADGHRRSEQVAGGKPVTPVGFLRSKKPVQAPERVAPIDAHTVHPVDAHALSWRQSVADADDPRPAVSDQRTYLQPHVTLGAASERRVPGGVAVHRVIDQGDLHRRNRQDAVLSNRISAGSRRCRRPTARRSPAG